MISSPVRFTPAVETVNGNEIDAIQDINKTFNTILETTAKDYGHAVRSVHAKTHGIFEGVLTIDDNLPIELAQGLFAKPSQHKIFMRMSINAGDILPDAISLPRGLALKVLDVHGERLPGAEGTTQDFVMVNGNVFKANEAKIATAVRINALNGQGLVDLKAAIPTQPDFVLYPMAAHADEMVALDAAIGRIEADTQLPAGRIGIVPVCETALGVADVRLITKGSARIKMALLGAEDLAFDLQAERSRDGDELEYARRRFLLECRAAGIEPIGAPYTYADIEGLSNETRKSKRLSYKSKSLVRPDHAAPLNELLTPSSDDIARANAVVSAFEAARATGKDRVLVDGLWIEVPTYRNAQRLLQSVMSL